MPKAEVEHRITHTAKVRLPHPRKVTMAEAVVAVQSLGDKAPADAEVHYDEANGVLSATWERSE